MPSKKPKYTLRIDEDVLNNIRIFAKEDSRSLNMEIEFILKQYSINRGAFGEDTLKVKKEKKK